jgi:hypothetical protein
MTSQVYITEHSSIAHSYDAVEIMGHWPLYYPGTRTLLLDLYKYVPSSEVVECSFSPHFTLSTEDWDNAANYAGKRSGRSVAWHSNRETPGRSKRQEVVHTRVSGSESGNKMDCSANTKNCKAFTCYIGKLRKNDTISIRFLSVLNTNSITNERISTSNLTMTPFFEILTVAQDTSNNPLVYGPEGKAASATDFIETEAAVGKKDFNWLIILSVFIGLLLLGVAVIIMVCCCGFCNDSNKNSHVPLSTRDDNDVGETKV